MGVFNFMETSFIISLGITFVLILLLIYHFKQRLTASESKQDTMFEIINNLAQELNNVKGHVGQLTMMTRPSTPYPFNSANNNIIFSHEKVGQNDEPDEESMEDGDEDEDEDEDDERIIVSDDDDEDDDISVEELSDDEEEDSQNDSIEVEDVEIQNVEKEETEEIELTEPTEKEEKEQVNFSKMNLGSLKAYIVEKGLVKDASKMKKAQILSLIQEQQPAI
jgi:hypothetical protein